VLKNFPGAAGLDARLVPVANALQWREYGHYWLATCRMGPER